MAPLSNKNSSFESSGPGISSGKHRPNTNLAVYLKTSQNHSNLPAPLPLNPLQRRTGGTTATNKNSSVGKKKTSLNPNHTTGGFQSKQVFSPFRHYRESIQKVNSKKLNQTSTIPITTKPAKAQQPSAHYYYNALKSSKQSL
jgi:hypothetical protein